jgi:hypothetical protein
VVLRNDESGLAAARSFFSPLGTHTALIDALRRFGDELGGGPKP